MIREHQLVLLRRLVGTVVGVRDGGAAFEVEFPGVVVVAVPAQALVPVSDDEPVLWDPSPAALHVTWTDLVIDQAAE